MDQKDVKKLVSKGAASVSLDTKNPQTRQVIATAGKLRIQVVKGDPNGTKNN